MIDEPAVNRILWSHLRDLLSDVQIRSIAAEIADTCDHMIRGAKVERPGAARARDDEALTTVTDALRGLVEACEAWFDPNVRVGPVWSRTVGGRAVLEALAAAHSESMVPVSYIIAVQHVLDDLGIPADVDVVNRVRLLAAKAHSEGPFLTLDDVPAVQALLEKAQAENERLVEALEFYAESESCGATARAALDAHEGGQR